MKYKLKLLVIFSLLSVSVLSVQNNLDLKIYPDVVYGHKFGMALTMDVYQPQKQNGAAILLMNSGGYQSPFIPQQYRNLKSNPRAVNKNYTFISQDEYNTPDFMHQFSFQDILEAGYTVFDVRHGSTPKFTLDEIVKDCELALDFVIDNSNCFDVSSEKIGIWGASAGASLAAYLGFNESSKVNSLVLYYPGGYNYLKYPELIKMLPALQIEKDLLNKLSLKNFISKNDPPTLILYGELDSDFITDPSKKIYNDLDSLGVETKLIGYPNVGHIWRGKDAIFNTEISNKAMSELIQWFDLHLIN